jgi:nucleoside-diphosphate-sugar epimerase
VESSVYPAQPDSDYGWEKLFSERLYMAFNRNYKIPVRIARFHNIYGPFGTWQGGKEKAPAAICRKVAESVDQMEIWGDGKQTRSFMYIDDCVEAVIQFMRHESFMGPVNIGSEEMVTINELARIAIKTSGKQVKINYINGPIGVMGRTSDNTLYRTQMDWSPSISLSEGIGRTYNWIESELNS